MTYVDNPLFGFVPVGYQATRWMAHLRTEVFSLGAQHISDVFFCSRSGVRPAQPYSARGLPGVLVHWPLQQSWARRHRPYPYRLRLVFLRSVPKLFRKRVGSGAKLLTKASDFFVAGFAADQTDCNAGRCGSRVIAYRSPNAKHTFADLTIVDGVAASARQSQFLFKLLYSD